MTAEVLCSLEAVEKGYEAGGYRLGPLTMEICAGEVLGLRGPNGAGKSTLLQLLAGTLAPDRGRLTRPAGPVGYVPQEIALYETMSCRDNLLFWGAVYGLPRRQARVRARWLLEKLELADKAGARAADCSGGMRRRLHLASGLMGSPRLLLLDEPTVGADARSAELILSALEHQRRQGRTVVLVTHQAGELERVCDRILELEDGRLRGEARR